MTLKTLPGSNFKPSLKTQPEIKYDDQGMMWLQPGDYVIPAMAFCLNLKRHSPAGSIYSLIQLQGSSAKIIRQINLKAYPKYSVSEVQNLIWNITGGLNYSEMDSRSQKIIDDVIPEFKPDLEKSYYDQVKDKWDKVATRSQGIIPTLDDVTSEYLDRLG